MRYLKQGRIFVLLLTLLVLTGCPKWSANTVIKKANKSKTDAQAVQADVYVSETMNAGDSALAKANEAFSSKQWKIAIEQAKIADESFKKASQDVEAAKVAIQGKKKTLDDLLAKADAVLAKAQEGNIQVLDNNAYIAAASAMAAAKDKANTQKNRNDLQRTQDYDTLINEAIQPAVAAAQKAFDITLADQARQRHNMFDPLNQELVEIVQNPLYRPASADALEPKVSTYYDNYKQGNYEAAMAQLDQIQEEFNTVLNEARKMRAEASLIQARDARDRSDTNLNASKAVPDIFNKAATAIGEGETAADSGDFATAYTKAQEAINTLGQVDSEMTKRAQDFIAQGRELIKQGDEVEVLKYQADRFNAGIAALDEAEQKLGEQDLRNGFAKAEEGFNDVSGAILETKRLKADQALERARTVLRRVENEGAPQYAPAAYGKARNSFDKAQTAYNSQQYIEVLQLSDTAETDANAVVGALNERAQQEIASAKIALASASQAQSEKYQSQQMQRVKDNVNQAEATLAQEQYRASIEASLSAQQTARAAENETYRQRTDETRELALAEQRLGADAGAKEHTPVLYNNGLEALRRAQDLYSTREYKNALHAALDALDSLRKARFRKIDEADAAVESARAALAEKYTPSDIQTAMSHLADARIAMNEARYPQSNQLADQAKQEAEASENVTWRLRSEEQLAANQANITRLTNNLAADKVREPFARAAALQGEANAIHKTSQFKAAYEKSVQAKDVLNETEKKLQEAAAADIAELKNKANGIVALGGGSFTASQVATVYNLINAASASLKENRYREAFDQVKAGNVLAQTVDRSVKDNILAQGVADARIALASAEQSGKAGFLPRIVADIKTRLNTLDAQKSVMTYDQAKSDLDNLQAEINDMENQARLAISAGLQEVQRLLDEARRAQALNYIRDKYFDATDKYKKAEAYRELLEPPQQGNFNDMLLLFKDAIVSASIVHADTNRIRDEKAYKDLIFYNPSSYMNDMASLLNQFASVTDFSPQFFRASKSSADVDIYKQMQKRLTAEELLKRAQYLYDSVSNYTPPKTLTALHSNVVDTFKNLVISADYFVKYGEYGRYENQLRQQFIEKAFEHLEKVKILNQKIEEELLAQEREATEGPIKAKNWFQKFWAQVVKAWKGPERYRHVNMPRN